MSGAANVNMTLRRGFGILELLRDWREVNVRDAKVLDPKVPLSIERTLLRWLRSGVILSHLAVQ